MDANPGPTRLRTRIVYNHAADPCGTTQYGEVEDYSIYVLSWLVVDSLHGNIQAGNDMQIGVTLNAANMALGIYTAELQIFSNDPDDPEIIVPITLNITEAAAFVTADQDTICQGEPVQLNTEVIGSTGPFEYTWSSVPEGFTSTEANPIVSPDTTTVYNVSITDGTLTLESSITITVNPLPVVSLGGDVSICEGDSAILDAGAGFSSYLWNTGDTTQTISAGLSGDYSVEVSNEYGCTNSDTLNLIVNALPAVDLGFDTTICVYHVIDLDAGNPGSTYAWSDGSTSQMIMVDSTGMVDNMKTLWVDVTTTAGCTSADTITINFIECLGIDENAGLAGFSIYPNPGNGFFTLKFGNRSEMKASLYVVNSVGEKVYRMDNVMMQPQASLDLNLRSLAEGTYTLVLTSGKELSQTKIIISK
jgi:hypothetical protein